METQKLYKVTLQGMHTSFSIRHDYGTSFVIAVNPDEAYQKVRAFLDENNLGFVHERELKCVELIAEQKDYPDCGTILYL